MRLAHIKCRNDVSKVGGGAYLPTYLPTYIVIVAVRRDLKVKEHLWNLTADDDNDFSSIGVKYTRVGSSSVITAALNHFRAMCYKTYSSVTYDVDIGR